jgi:hypothetical protein
MSTEGIICLLCKNDLVITDPNSIIIESRICPFIKRWCHKNCFVDSGAQSLVSSEIVTVVSHTPSPIPVPIVYKIQHCNDPSNPPQICPY